MCSTRSVLKKLRGSKLRGPLALGSTALCAISSSMGTPLLRDPFFGHLEGPTTCGGHSFRAPLSSSYMFGSELQVLESFGMGCFVLESSPGLDPFQDARPIRPTRDSGYDIGVTRFPSISFLLDKLLLQFCEQCRLNWLRIRIQKGLSTRASSVFRPHSFLHQVLY